MADRITPFRDIKADASSVVDRIKSDVDQIVGELDFEQMSQKVQDFGKQNPVALAVAALTIGVAAGLLMRGKAFEGSSIAKPAAPSSAH